MTNKFVSYYRVSTARQGKSGLGLDAQKYAVEEYLNTVGASLINEFTEVESGKINNRTELLKALTCCRIHGATLLIAKLDRLSRNAAFLLTLRDSGVNFKCTDMPDANALTVGIMAVIAQDERERISQRTKAALRVAKARGVKLGGDRGNIHLHAARGAQNSLEVRRNKAKERQLDLMPEVQRIVDGGIVSASGIARELNQLNILTARGGKWSATQVQRLNNSACK